MKSEQRLTNWAMIAIGVLAAVVAAAIPGYRTLLILFGGALAGWGSFVPLRPE